MSDGRHRPASPPVVRLALLALGLVAAAGGVFLAYLVYRSYGRLVPGVEERAFDNAARLYAFQERAGLAWEQGAQRSVLGRGIVGSSLTAFYSLAYWPFVVGAAALTFRRDRPTFRLLRNAFAVSGAIGLAMILVAPVAPPRLLAGFDDHVAGMGLGSIAHPSSLFNPYAAVPSFHVAWTTLAALALARSLAPGPVGRAVLVAIPAVMSVSVVTTGNHFVLDVVAGLALIVVAWDVAPRMERAFEESRRRTTARRARRAAPAQSSPRLHIASRS